jgi:YegS/Rv2252/BmrU family lipid kinase
MNLQRTRKRICFIVNPVSGVGKKGYLPTYIDKYLDHRRFEYVIWHTKAPRHATELARKAVQEGFPIVVAVGGDGSVNEVSDGLLGSDTTLGILPLGSGNAFATHLGISRRLAKAFEVINEGNKLLSDVGYVDFGGSKKRLFVATSGLGFAAYVAYQIKGSKIRGFLAYLTLALKSAFLYKSKTYRIQLDQSNTWIERKCYVVEVSNNKYYGYGTAIAPLADIEDGLLNLTLILDRPRWQYFASLWRMFNLTIHKADFIEHYTARNITIEAPHSTPLHRDGEGEFSSATTLYYSIKSKILRVLVP